MRRIVFLVSLALKGKVAGPLSESHFRLSCGCCAMRGSDAIQIMKGSNGSLASAEDLANAARMGPGFMPASSPDRGVLTVSEPETNSRMAVATPRRTEGSGSLAGLGRRVRGGW